MPPESPFAQTAEEAVYNLANFFRSANGRPLLCRRCGGEIPPDSPSSVRKKGSQPAKPSSPPSTPAVPTPPPTPKE